jgi:hypothetical protein
MGLNPAELSPNWPVLEERQRPVPFLSMLLSASSASAASADIASRKMDKMLVNTGDEGPEERRSSSESGESEG